MAEEPSNYWFKSKYAFDQISLILESGNSDLTSDLEEILTKNRPTFINLLKNETKNASDRQKVFDAAKSGENLPLFDRSVKIAQRLADEAVILSELFDINELRAVELVLAGQQETPNFPGFPRGLCAILCYFHKHCFDVQTLRYLFQSSGGRMWSSQFNDNLASIVGRFVHGLIKDNLIGKIIDVLSSCDVSKELDKLQQPNVKGLGGPKHRKLVSDLISQTYETLSDCILLWSCQHSFTITQFNPLILFLRNTDLPYGFRKIEASLLMAVLYAIDTSLLDAVDLEDDLNLVPLSQEETILNGYHSQIYESAWKFQPLQSVVQFAWAVTIRTLAQHHLAQQVVSDFTEDEEDMLERALEHRPFHYIKYTLLQLEGFGSNELWMRRTHSLITQFILYFPIKIKELRSRADEEIRIAQEALNRGETIPALSLHFEQFMLLIGDLYSMDRNLKLCDEYWCSPDTVTGSDSIMQIRFTQRQINLYKFVRSMGDQGPALMLVAYLKMLTGLSNTQLSSEQAFSLLNNNSLQDAHLSCMSLDHFFGALRQYHQTFKADLSLSFSHHRLQQNVEITQEEQEGLISWIELGTKIALKDQSSCLTICDHPSWTALQSMFGLLTCPISLNLKGSLMNFLAKLAKCQNVVHKLWQGLIGAGLLIAGPEAKAAGLQRELEEIECRNQSYPATIGFLQFLSSLCDHSHDMMPVSESFDPFMNFVIDSILIKFLNRSYKETKQMWQTGKFGVEVLWKLVREFDPTIDGVKKQEAGFKIMTQLMIDGPLFRMMVSILDEGVRFFDQYTDFPGKSDFEGLTLAVLRLFHQVLAKENLLQDAIREAGVTVLISSLDLSLQTLNPKTMQADYIAKIACYLQYSKLPNHCLAAARVLRCISGASSSIQPKLVQYCNRSVHLKRRILSGFVDCLTVDGVSAPFGMDVNDSGIEATNERLRGLTAICVIELIYESLKIGAGEPNLAYFLLGFDTKRPENTHLENPGINDFPHTCLHSLVFILKSCMSQTWADIEFGSLIEPTARLMLLLASTRSTAEPMLRYLRTAHDLIFELVQTMVREPSDSLNTESSLVLSQLCALVLKLAATELRFLSAGGQTSQASRLATILLEQDQTTTIGQQATPESRLMTVLRLVDFTVPDQPNPDLHFFDARRLSQVITACTVQSSSGGLQCDVVRLHKLLIRETSSLQGTPYASQQASIYKEIETILEHVVVYNQLQRTAAANVLCFEGWRLVVEVLFSVVLMNLGSAVESQIMMVAHLATALLKKANESDLVPELATGVASTVLHLTGCVRELFAKETMEETEVKRIEDGSTFSQQYVSVLDRTHGDKAFDERNWKHLAALLPAFRLIIEFLLKPGNRSPNTRLLSYGAFLNMLLLNKKPKEVDWANLDGLSLREKMIDDQWNIFERYGPEMVELLAKDSCEGPDVCKTMALSCLSSILHQDSLREAKYISLIVKAGYIRHLVESLNQYDDAKLAHLMKNLMTSLRPLYVFQTKMALFMRVAMSHIGIEALCHNKLLQNMQIWTFWTEIPDELFVAGPSGTKMEDLQAHLGLRYLTTFEVCLKLCLALSATARGSQDDIKQEVTGFVRIHGALLSQLIRLKPQQDTAASRVVKLAAKLVAQSYGTEIQGDSPKLNGKNGDRLIDQLKIEARKLVKRSDNGNLNLIRSPGQKSFFKKF